MNETPAPVYVVDDDLSVCESLGSLIRSAGLRVEAFASGQEFLARPKIEVPGCLVLDVKLPGLSGLDLQQELAKAEVEVPIIFLTGYADIPTSVRAMKAGALEFFTKPFDDDALLEAIRQGIARSQRTANLVPDGALEAKILRVQNPRIAAEKASGSSIVAEGPAMRRLLETVSRVAPKDITLLIRGETGTGKELIASLVHANSRRAARPFVRFNCAAIPGELAEAELFGHARGAFTGAVQAHRGFFAQADGGTLVLDEVGELPLPVQAKLLRALQDGEIQPVGAGRVDRVDVRVVACTHRDLAGEVRAGRFREDLYYRLAVLELVVPPLREHREDIPSLAAEFARRQGERFGMQGVRLSPELLDALQRMDWPGNVRQLENAVARILALGTGGEIGLEAFGTASAAPSAQAGAEGPPPEGTLSLREQVEAVERSLIGRTMTDVGGNQSEAARRLGLSRGSLIVRLKKYGQMIAG
jgi:two-component system response regulator AtoC